MTTYDLNAPDPEPLVQHLLEDDAFAPGLIEAIRTALPAWNERTEQRLYHAYRRKFAQLLHAGTDTTDLLKFCDHLALTTSALRTHGQAALAHKLTTMIDLLGDEVALKYDHGIDHVLHRDHVRPLLALLAKSENKLPRARVRKGLGISEPNLSRVLDVTEAARLIARRREGNEVVVMLTPLGQSKTNAPKRSEQRREHDGIPATAQPPITAYSMMFNNAVATSFKAGLEVACQTHIVLFHAALQRTLKDRHSGKYDLAEWLRTTNEEMCKSAQNLTRSSLVISPLSAYPQAIPDDWAAWLAAPSKHAKRAEIHDNGDRDAVESTARRLLELILPISKRLSNDARHLFVSGWHQYSYLAMPETEHFSKASPPSPLHPPNQVSHWHPRPELLLKACTTIIAETSAGRQR